MKSLHHLTPSGLRKPPAPARLEELVNLIEAGRAALARFDNEEAIACFETALTSPFLNTEQRASVCCLLAEALENLDRFSEAIEVISEYEQTATRATLHPVVLQQVYLRLGSVYGYAADRPKAIAYVKNALALAEEREDASEIGLCHLVLGRIYRAIGETRFARDHYLQALKLHRLAGRALALAHSYHGLGTVCISEGDFAGARNYFDQALKLLSDQDSPLLLGNIYMNLAVLVLIQEHGQASEGVEYLQRAVHFFERAKNKRLLSRAYSNLGFNLLHLGETRRAKEVLQASLDLSREIGEKGAEGNTLETLGELELICGQFAEAEKSLRLSIEIAQSLSGRFNEAQAYLTLGRCYLLQNQYAQASEAFQNSLKVAEQMSDKRGQAAAQLYLAETRYEAGEHEATRRMLAEVSGGIERLANTSLIGHLRELTGRLEADEGRLNEAIHYLGQAVSIFEMVANPYRSGVAYYYLGRIYGRTGQMERAREELEKARDLFISLDAQPMLQRTEEALEALARRLVRVAPATLPESAGLSGATILRLAGAASSRELLLHELTLILHQDLAAAPVIVYERTPDGKLNPIAHQGCSLAQAEAIAQEVAAFSGAKAPSKAALYELRAGDRLQLALYAGYENSQSPSRRQFVEPLIKLAEMGLELCLLRSQIQTVEDYDLSASKTDLALPGLIYQSAAMKSLIEQIHKIRSSNVTALITGESGTGKEVIARAIHAMSDRREAPFVAFNCTITPKELIDSQLFGHRRGAFTGAAGDYQGVIRSAAGGTLFLDEVGDLALEVQPKLLRFLQEGEIQPLGETKPVRVDVRVIAATNCDIEKLVAEGRFREDLYYRLNVIRLHMPPLRERREEIPLLVKHLLDRYAEQAHKENINVTPQAMDQMIVYHWPGNVRQLANEIQRLVALTPSGGEIRAEHLSLLIRRTDGESQERKISSVADVISRSALDQRRASISPFPALGPQRLADAVAELERRLIEESFERHGGNISRMAQELGLTRRGLYLKLERYQIRQHGRS
jgi:DNA-binding NtrC family response regulator/tetratricopeptide (TPR) repeat protein